MHLAKDEQPEPQSHVVCLRFVVLFFFIVELQLFVLSLADFVEFFEY